MSRFRPKAPFLIAAGVCVAVLGLIIGFVSVYQVAYADRVYPGVRALGHDLGGYSRQEARLTLQRALEEFGRRQVTLMYREHSWSMSAQDLGLRADVDAVLDSIMKVGREGNVFERFSTQLGLMRQGRSYEQPSAAFDPQVQSALLKRLAGEIDRPVREARLGVGPDFKVQLAEAQSGRKLDLEGSQRQLQSVLSNASVERVELVVVETAPPNAENNLSLAAEQAARILAAPITMTHAGKSWSLDRSQLASILRFNPDLNTREAAFLDRPALEAWTKSLAQAVHQTPEDARLSWNGGKLEVLRESRDGVDLDVAATVDAIVAEASGEHRPIPLPVQIVKPAVPMEDRHNLGIKTLIESAKTSFAGSVPAKQANITLASKRLNGVVVPPGATFSFNKELGPTTLDAGFQTGWGITMSASGVRTVPSVAGGICQVATTLFHTVFWSGYQIEERNWHLYWIPAYTSKGVVGLDATVDEEAGLDFQFINTTKHHLLIQSWVDEALNLNFALYGTRPEWVVKVEPSEKTNIVAADSEHMVIQEETTMAAGNRVQVERATDGFVVTNIRNVIEDGETRTLRLVSRYQPSRNVTLVGTGGKPASSATRTEAINKPAPEPRVTPPAATSTAATPATPGAQPSDTRTTPTAESTKPPAATATPKPAAPTTAPTSKPASATATPRRR